MFKDPGDTLEPYLSIKAENKGCVMAADPKHKKVSDHFLGQSACSISLYAHLIMKY